jgi:hypothetical protein
VNVKLQAIGAARYTHVERENRVLGTKIAATAVRKDERRAGVEESRHPRVRIAYAQVFGPFYPR